MKKFEFNILDLSVVDKNYLTRVNRTSLFF